VAELALGENQLHGDDEAAPLWFHDWIHVSLFTLCVALFTLCCHFFFLDVNQISDLINGNSSFDMQLVSTAPVVNRQFMPPSTCL
jgi:hypothetical protein